jgi:predicted DNA-binding transcriptional regulator YafY
VGDLLDAQEPIPVAWEDAAGFGVPGPTVEMLREAARVGQWVELDYEGRAGTRSWRLRPLGLERNGRLVYLHGLGEPLNQRRSFRADRIRGLRLTPAPRPGSASG